MGRPLNERGGAGAKLRNSATTKRLEAARSGSFGDWTRVNGNFGSRSPGGARGDFNRTERKDPHVRLIKRAQLVAEEPFTYPE